MKTKNTQKNQFEQNTNQEENTYSKNSHLTKTNILGINITNTTTKAVLEYLDEILLKTQRKLSIVTPNPEIVMLARHLRTLKEALNGADLALCDGVGLLWAARLMGKPLKERIIGTNFMESLCEKVNDWPITVGFLGGGPHVAESVADCLVQKYPKLKVGYVGQEWNKLGFENAKKFNTSQTLPLIPSSGGKAHSAAEGRTLGFKQGIKNFSSPQSTPVKSVDILFVAYGAPKQELWMMENKDRLDIRVMMGVGGAFDQIVDSSLRPPIVVHQLGFGWLYRLIRQPWRIKRQLVLIQFVGLVLKEKFFSAAL